TRNDSARSWKTCPSGSRASTAETRSGSTHSTSHRSSRVTEAFDTCDTFTLVKITAESHIRRCTKIRTRIYYRAMPTRLTQSERREQTRRGLLEAARRVFGARGYGAATLEEIAGEAGGTRGALYYNFPA